MEQCREQMLACIEAMDRELLAQHKLPQPALPARKTTASNPNV